MLESLGGVKAPVGGSLCSIIPPHCVRAKGHVRTGGCVYAVRCPGAFLAQLGARAREEFAHCIGARDSHASLYKLPERALA